MNKPMNLTDSQFRCVMNTARSVAAQVAREEARRYAPEGTAKLEALNEELSAQNSALGHQVQQLIAQIKSLDNVLGIRTDENHALQQKLEAAVAQNVSMGDEIGKLHEELRICREQRALERKELAQLRTQLGGIVAENRGKLRLKVACELSPDTRADFVGLEEGDRWLNTRTGEIFTFFMGQWRRRSELEGFASAKKYL